MGLYPPRPNASEAQTFKTLAFAFSVFHRVIDPKVMSLQEPVELVAGLNFQKRLQWGRAELKPVTTTLLLSPLLRNC